MLKTMIESGCFRKKMKKMQTSLGSKGNGYVRRVLCHEYKAFLVNKDKQMEAKGCSGKKTYHM